MRLRDKWNALILGRRDINEADRLLTVFSREKGLARLVAKGVRKIPSRRGGHVEPFTRVRCVVTGHPERMYLQAAEAVEEYLPLRRDQEALEHAVYLAGMVTSFYQDDDPDEELFEALCRAWEILPETTRARRITLETALLMYILQANGMQPGLKSCRMCGVSKPTEAVVMDAGAGGWSCLSCRVSLAGATVSITPRLLKAIKWLAVYPERALSLNLPDAEAEQLSAAMRSYVSAVRSEHFAAERSRMQG